MTTAKLTLTSNATANAIPAPNATEAALTLIRDESVTVADLARYFGQSETWGAGLVHAVIGDDDFAFTASEDGYDPSPAEMADYQDGFRHGLMLVDATADADGWAECYALAAVEAAQAAVLLPVCNGDCPF